MKYYEIKGSVLAWVIILIMLLKWVIGTTWYDTHHREIIKIIILIYTIWNIIGLVLMHMNYEDNYFLIPDQNTIYVWNLENWVVTESLKEKIP